MATPTVTLQQQHQVGNVCLCLRAAPKECIAEKRNPKYCMRVHYCYKGVSDVVLGNSVVVVVDDVASA
eukprot:3647656-Amphidinium_carterae.1